jgi:Tol biopolymer transport system component
LVDADTNGVGSIDEEVSALSLSPGGEFVAFSSPDGNLVGLDKNRATDVFMWDADKTSVELISQRNSAVVPQTGDDFSSLSQLSVSADGRYVTFASVADDLMPNDTNREPDVFVHDLQTGTNILVSVANGGGSALGGVSCSPTITPNGRYVVFVSAATNLVTGLPVTNFNVYRRDLQGGTTILVSVSVDGLSGGSGDSSDPVISADGRYVTFLSGAGNLAPNQFPSFRQKTYWRDVQAGVTLLLPATPPSQYSVFPPSMSSDGRYVCYSYYGANPGGLRPPVRIRDTQLGTDIYTNGLEVSSVSLSPNGTVLLYKVAGTLYLADVASGSNLFSLTSAAPLRNSAEWSADSRYFAFVSTTNPITGDDGLNKVYLYDLLTGTISWIAVSGPSTGSVDTWSDSPALSGDGRFVAYRSAVTNTVPGDNDTPPHIFLFDRITGSNTVLTAGQAGSSPVWWVSRPAISGNGDLVDFLSLGSGAVSEDLNRVQDAFASAVDTGTALQDTDADGIPDWWMMKYFGHPTGQAGDLSRAQDDADGDGMTTLQEYLTGTDPTDAASVFRLQLSAVVTPNNNVSLNWQAAEGKSYQVQYKDNLGDPVWLNATGNAWVIGNQGYFAAPAATQPRRFYRVVGVD